MENILEIMSLRFGLPAETILLTVFGLGVLLVFVAVTSALSRRHPAAVRIANLRAQRYEARNDRGLLRETLVTPKGLFKAALPSREAERRKIEDQLIQAGLTGRNALRIYTLTRVWLGIFVPMIVGLLIVASRTPGIPVPSAITGIFESISKANAIQLIGLLTAVGYFVPAAWLKHRRKERQQREYEERQRRRAGDRCSLRRPRSRRLDGRSPSSTRPASARAAAGAVWMP